MHTSIKSDKWRSLGEGRGGEHLFDVVVDELALLLGHGGSVLLVDAVLLVTEVGLVVRREIVLQVKVARLTPPVVVSILSKSVRRGSLSKVVLSKTLLLQVVLVIQLLGELVFSFVSGAVVRGDLQVSCGLFLALLLLLGQVGDIVVLDSKLSPALQVMVELVEFMLDVVLQGSATVASDVMVVVITLMVAVGVVVEVLRNVTITVVVALEVAPVGVLSDVAVGVVANEVGWCVVPPVVWAQLEAVDVVVLVDVLREVLPLVVVVVVVAKVLVALWLHIVVLTVLLASEVSLVAKVRQVVLQVPVALLEVSVGVVLESVHKLSLLVHLLGVSNLIRGQLFVDVHLRCEVGVSLLVNWLLIRVAIDVSVAERMRLLIRVAILVFVVSSKHASESIELIFVRLSNVAKRLVLVDKRIPCLVVALSLLADRFLGCRSLLLGLLLVHLLVEESSLGTHVLLSLSLGARDLGVVIRAVSPVVVVATANQVLAVVLLLLMSVRVVDVALRVLELMTTVRQRAAVGVSEHVLTVLLALLHSLDV